MGGMMRGVMQGAGRAAAVPVDDTPAPKRKERNAIETKRRILEAAATEFAAKGFDGARLGTIARAAEVQQALIHHYFSDKEGLHAEVVRAGLAAMTEGIWELLARMDAPAPEPPAPKKPKARSESTKKRSREDLRVLADGFVDLLLRFFANNRGFLAILQHEAQRETDDATSIVKDKLGPIFDGVVARLDAMRERGEVRADVDTKHLVLSCVAMVAFPFQEEAFVTAIWPANWQDAEFLAERRRNIVAMIVDRIAP
ncbi:Transcriptional regulator, TetR family [Labilithrix luteola]|uniref:Transcriptional regulator, TetR family n=1 Tax=Labilithrix luteola TaxID=1391654 RepID=A0A0K1PVR8_9BACT|nr:TetR/AcrR family transcriptional regulator [Labilithrix luteola]AKU97628.1 Transcriptional regulator, TetR family [Labilithrix luteola]